MANPSLALTAPAPPSLLARPNVAAAERTVSVLLGGLLAYYGLRHRRSAAGWASTVAGGLMLERGVTGRCVVYRAMGIDTATPPAVHMRQAVQVMKPRHEVYSFWRDLENLPRFMKHVRRVEVREGGRSHWTVQVAPAPVLEWDARIVDDRPGERIAWRSTEDAQVENAGEVRFEDLPGGRGTGVLVEIAYRPPAGALGSAAAHVLKGITEQELREDLRRFKSLVETGEIARVAGQPSGRGRDAEEPGGGSGGDLGRTR